MIGLISIIAAIGCGGETNFSNNSDDGASEQGVAQMVYSHESMIFTDLNWEDGISSGQAFTITNVGTNDLSVTTIDIADSGDGVFYVQGEDDLILAPELEREFTVVATLDVNAPAYGEMRIKSNYSEARDLRIPLCAFPAGYKGDMTCAADDTGAGDTGSGDTGE